MTLGKVTKTRAARKFKKTCDVCQKEFSGSPKKKYCNNACKQKAYRIRLTGHIPSKFVEENHDIPSTCFHCKSTYWSNGRSRYCSDSCKTLAYRQRRKTAILALAVVYNMPQDKVHDLMDSYGMKKLSSLLVKVGYRYNQEISDWQQRQLN